MIRVSYRGAKRRADRRSNTQRYVVRAIEGQNVSTADKREAARYYA